MPTAQTVAPLVGEPLYLYGRSGHVEQVMPWDWFRQESGDKYQIGMPDFVESAMRSSHRCNSPKVGRWMAAAADRVQIRPRRGGRRL